MSLGHKAKSALRRKQANFSHVRPLVTIFHLQSRRTHDTFEPCLLAFVVRGNSARMAA